MSLPAAKAAAVENWPLDEASGTRAATINGNDLGDNNTVGSASGLFGTSALFVAANNEYLAAADSADLSFGNIDVSICFWGKLTSQSATFQTFLYKGGDAGSAPVVVIRFENSPGLYVGPTVNVYSGAFYADETILRTSSQPLDWTTGWHLLAFKHDSANNVIGMSVDGAAFETTAYSAGLYDDTGTLTLGSGNPSAIQPLDGQMEDLTVIKGYCLSDADVAEIWNSGTGVAFADWDAGGGTDYPLTAGQGSFALTGQTASLNRGLKVVAGQGSFALSGQSAGLYHGLKVAASVGTFTLSGQSAGLSRTRNLAAAQGTFTLTGQAATFPVTRRIVAAQGAYTLSGQAATLVVPGKLTADVGSFTLTGQAATLRVTRTLPCAVGTFTFTGQSAGLSCTRRLTASVGSFVLSGQAATLTYSGLVFEPLTVYLVSERGNVFSLNSERG